MSTTNIVAAFNLKKQSSQMWWMSRSKSGFAMHDDKTLRDVKNSLFRDAFYGIVIIRSMDIPYELVI